MFNWYFYDVQVRWCNAGQWLQWMPWCPSLLTTFVAELLAASASLSSKVNKSALPRATGAKRKAKLQCNEEVQTPGHVKHSGRSLC